MFDTIVADLKCARCGALVKDAAMPTQMRPHPAAERFRVGDAIEVDWNGMWGNRYLPVEPLSEPARILEQWDCAVCGSVYNWAEIIIRDGRIESIEAVPLTQESLRRAHFINVEVTGVAAAMTDKK